MKYDPEKDKILRIAKEFTDLCTQISYVRENIKTIIQQYSFIGTQKIISDIVRDYFLKNYSKKSDWRLIADRNTKNDQNLLSLDTLNGIKQTNSTDEVTNFFNVNIIEYYDNTPYLNIYAELPSCIVGYHISGQILQETPIILDEDQFSSWPLVDNLVSANFSPIYVENR